MKTHCVICQLELSARVRNLSDGPLYMNWLITDAQAAEQMVRNSIDQQIDKLWCPNCGILYHHE